MHRQSASQTALLGDIGSYPAGHSFGAGMRARPLRKMSATDKDLFRSSVNASHGRNSTGSPLPSKRRRRRSRSSATKRPTSSFSWGARLSSSLRSRLLIVLMAMVSPSRHIAFPVMSLRLIRERPRGRMLPPRRIQPALTRAPAPEHRPRFVVIPSLHRKRISAPGGRPGHWRFRLLATGISRVSEFAFVYAAFLACRQAVHSVD